MQPPGCAERPLSTRVAPMRPQTSQAVTRRGAQESTKTASVNLRARKKCPTGRANKTQLKLLA